VRDDVGDGHRSQPAIGDQLREGGHHPLALSLAHRVAVQGVAPARQVAARREEHAPLDRRARDPPERRRQQIEVHRQGRSVPFRRGRQRRAAQEIEARPASAYEHWVGSEGLSFGGRDDAERLGDVVKFHWKAVAKDGEAFAVGLNFLVLPADGRIERGYTFVVA
jgi:hypothetical protein